MNLNENQINEIINIINSSEEDQIKVDKIMKITDLDTLKKITYLVGFNNYKDDKKLRKIAINYKYYDAAGLFKKHKSPYKCNMEELKNRLDNLNKIFEIVKSEEDDSQKLSKILDIYRSYDEFKKKYTLFLKFGANDERLISAREALNNFDLIDKEVNRLYNDKTLLKNMKYRKEIETFLENNNYLENYLYSEWIIKKYIDYDRNYLKFEFLNKYSISEEDFNYCVSLIGFLNPNLYREYQDSVIRGNEKRTYILDMTFRNLEHGIKTGILNDGTVFNILEFYKRIPFKNDGSNFRDRVFDFMSRIYGNQSSTFKTIGAYLYQNNIKTIRFINKEIMEKNPVTINNTLIDKKINDDIFRYIEAYNYPKILAVYNIVLRKYLNGEIYMDKVQEKENELKKIKAMKNKQLEVNPYVLIKK